MFVRSFVGMKGTRWGRLWRLDRVVISGTILDCEVQSMVAVTIAVIVRQPLNYTTVTISYYNMLRSRRRSYEILPDDFTFRRRFATGATYLQWNVSNCPRFLWKNLDDRSQLLLQHRQICYTCTKIDLLGTNRHLPCVSVGNLACFWGTSGDAIVCLR